MRLWTLHPKYLDRMGLVALWREGLLARKVLLDQTTGYKNHPQLIRFKKTKKPIYMMDCYLSEIFYEAKKRDYQFDQTKICLQKITNTITVTNGQIEYETKHLLKKLKKRDLEYYKKLKIINRIKQHPLFTIIPGDIEKWEKQK